LDFYLLPDGTYAVSAGRALYLSEITVPATYKGKAVTCIGAPREASEDSVEIWGSNGGFVSCPYLARITLPDSVTHIGHDAFSECDALKYIRLPSSLESCGEDIFPYNGQLSYTVYENGKYLGNESNPYVCLVDVVDETVTTFTVSNATKVIGESAFVRCESLQTITIPNSVTQIGDWAFQGCRSLQTITIPDSVKYIGKCAFTDCSSLQAITISAGVIEIGESAFQGDTLSALTSVVFVNKNGWCVNGTPVTITDDVAANAELLKVHYDKPWTRTDVQS
jgi:hypothetical protein